jgi:hypothetical protein
MRQIVLVLCILLLSTAVTALQDGEVNTDPGNDLLLNSSTSNVVGAAGTNLDFPLIKQGGRTINQTILDLSIDSESDPVYSAWDKSTGISITESQISDLGTTVSTDTERTTGLAAQDECSEITGCVEGAITATLTEEEVEDYVGGMLGGTETRITVDYDDGGNAINFVVDDMNDDTPESDDIDALCGTNDKILKRVSGTWQCADDATGGGGASIPFWITSGGNTTSNLSVNQGDVRITGRLSQNTSIANGDYAVALGRDGQALANYATVGGGYANTAYGDYATVGGGRSNEASGEYATVGGGRSNEASDYYATVGGGYTNTAYGYYPTVGGGYTNTASDDFATVGGGRSNEASGYSATVGGGRSNEASDYYATVGGGRSNEASDYYATVGGGYYNTASANYAGVASGQANTASGQYSFAAGGDQLVASANYATAFGRDFENADVDSFKVGYGDVTLNVTDGQVNIIGDLDVTGNINGGGADQPNIDWANITTGMPANLDTDSTDDVTVGTQTAGYWCRWDDGSAEVDCDIAPRALQPNIDGANVSSGTIAVARMHDDMSTDTERTTGLAAQDECSEITGCVEGAITATLTEEEVEDFVGGMLAGTETRITVTYDDTGNMINFVVDDMNDDDPEPGDVAWTDLTDDGTFTDTYLCTYDQSNSRVDCNTDPSTLGGVDLSFSDAAWIDEAGSITSNASVNSGNINVTGDLIALNLYLREAIHLGNVSINNTGGTLTLDPAGNKVNPGSDSTDSLGATGKVWSEGWFDNIKSDGGIDIKPASGSVDVFANGDSDDYLEFSTVSNIPIIKAVGSDKLKFSTSDFDYGFSLDSSGDGMSTYHFSQDGGDYGYIFMYNDAPFGIQSNQPIKLVPNADISDYVLLQTVSNIPYIGAYGGSDIYFHDGSSWETVHADAFTEHTNPYNGTVLQAYADLADWVDLKHPVRMASKIKKYEQIIDPITNQTYDGELIGEEIAGTDIGKAGKANALVNIRQKEEIEDLKERLNKTKFCSDDKLYVGAGGGYLSGNATAIWLQFP